MCTYEVLKDRENLETQFGTPVRGMAYPYATYDDRVVQCLKSCGIVYARTAKNTGWFDLPTDWLRLEPTCHHNDPRLMELAHTFVDKIILNKPWMFYLWGHSFEFDKYQNWNVMEEFAEFMGGRDDIWYATNIEIFDYCEAYSRLRFFVDGSRVFNPTAYPIWIEVNQKDYCVRPGEELMLV